MIKPTKRQLQVLAFVKSHIKKTGRAPSISEIGRKFEIDVSAAMRHLNAMEQKGMIHREPRKHHSIVVNKPLT